MCHSAQSQCESKQCNAEQSAAAKVEDETKKSRSILACFDDVEDSHFLRFTFCCLHVLFHLSFPMFVVVQFYIDCATTTTTATFYYFFCIDNSLDNFILVFFFVPLNTHTHSAAVATPFCFKLWSITFWKVRKMMMRRIELSERERKRWESGRRRLVSVSISSCETVWLLLSSSPSWSWLVIVVAVVANLTLSPKSFIRCRRPA